MSIQLQGKVIGAKQLENALNQLPKALAKSALKQILKKQAAPILESAKSNVPKRTGELRESLRIGPTLNRGQRRIQSKKHFVQMYVGASWPKGAHAHLIEFGTIHSVGQPFLRPAWDSHKDNLLKEVGVDMWKILEKKARTLAKKATKGTLSKRTIGELR